MTRLAYLAVFGLLGVFSRYAIGVAAARHAPPGFPYGTFAINVVGAFLIGVVYVVGAERGALSEDLRIGLMTGFLGGFTTFSSFALETMRLLEHGSYGTAGAYVGLSNVLGFGAAWAGMSVVRLLGA